MRRDPFSASDIVLAVGLLLVAVAAFIVGGNFLGAVGSSARRAGPPPKLFWDFTKGADLNTVRWPAEVRGELWRVDSPATITLIAPDGQRGEFDAHSFQVRREGENVRSVLISMQNEDSPAAYGRAKQLAEEWGVSGPPRAPGAVDQLQKLEHWYTAFKPGGSGKGVRMCQMIRNNPWPPRSVTIRSSYDEKAPWFVALGLGGLNEPPTTKPSSPSTQHESDQ